MGMVFPVSTHNYELRYWLAAGGIHPGFYPPDDISGQISADVLLSVTPPPQMPATLEAGTILGYCVGEPWNQQAVFKGIGVPVITDYEIWKNNPEKVFGITAASPRSIPNTTLALTKALIRAAMWLDEERQRQPRRGGEDPRAPELCRRRRGGDRQLDDRHLRIREGRQAAGARLQRVLPLLRDLPLLLRRRLVPHPDAPLGPDRRAKPDAWYHEVAKSVYRPDSTSRPRGCWSRTASRTRRTSPGTRRLPRADRRVHRRRRPTTAASPTPTSTVRRSA
jgi:nitrate/nitrite transport system substrate-binding protein